MPGSDHDNVVIDEVAVGDGEAIQVLGCGDDTLRFGRRQSDVHVPLVPNVPQLHYPIVVHTSQAKTSIGGHAEVDNRPSTVHQHHFSQSYRKK